MVPAAADSTAVALAAAAEALALALAAASLVSAEPRETTFGLSPIREFLSLAEGYAACEAAAAAFPFVVRSCRDFAPATSAAIRSSLRLEREVTGFRDIAGYCDHVKQSGLEALASWDAGVEAARREDAGEPPQLCEAVGQTCNIIDSECTRHAGMLPAALRDSPGADAVSIRLRLAYVLSPVLLGASRGSFGDLHVDPPMGGGWQYLAQGVKQWALIEDGVGPLQHYSRAACRKHSTPPDMALIAHTARVLTATLLAGDVISFPTGWPHAVATLEATLGLSGYHAAPPSSKVPCS